MSLSEQTNKELLSKLNDDYINTIIDRASGGTLTLEMFINRNAGINYLIRVLERIKD